MSDRLQGLYGRGGRTSLANAALICQTCNASKGNRVAAP